MIKTLGAYVKEFKRASIATPCYMILEVLMEMLYNDSKERQVRSVSNLGLNNMMKETYSALSSVFGEKLDEVWLYGSYARGDFDAESDVDIMALVDLPKEQLAMYRRKVSDLSSDLDLKYDVLLSIKLQDKDTFLRFSNTLPFFQNVMKEGKRVVQ